jgi:glutaminyl-peptide cyclotransferase
MGTGRDLGPKGAKSVPKKVIMPKFGSVILFSIFVIAQSFATAPPPSLTLVRKIPHTGYSEGIDFANGFIWSATPELLRKIDPATGQVVKTFAPATRYSESLSWWGNVLWNVSYSDNGIYRGSLAGEGFKFERKGQTAEVHAWGLTHDDKHLIMTGDHGSNKLYFYNPKTLKLDRTLTAEKKDLEDLAWDGKGIWTSSFTAERGRIFRINPKTGKQDGIFTIPEPEMCPIVDGIAVEGKNLWFTGKNCPSLYQVKNPLL